MTTGGPTRNVWRWVWLGLIGSGIAVAAVAGLFGIDQLTAVARLRLALGALIASEVAYVSVVLLGLAATPVLAALTWRRRRGGRPASWPARGLLLGVSLLFALVVGEVVAGVVWARRSAATAVAVGGSTRRSSQDVKSWPRAASLPAVPTRFEETKGPRDLEIVVVGESSAEGVPYSLFQMSPGTLLSWRLERVFPGRNVRLTVLAFSGNTLADQYGRLAELKRRPDLLLVYCGHNEFSARLPAAREVGHYVDQGEPSSWERLADGVERLSPVCRLLRLEADACRVAIPPPEHGDRRLVDVPAYTPAESAALLADFRARLESIAVFAERVGALLVLIVPAANDGALEPNRSYLPPGTHRPERDRFAAEFEAARRLEASDPREATRAYRELLERYPGFAESHFRLARLLQAAGETDEAYRHYVQARDLDGFPMRCLSAFQQAYRELAARHDCLLIDTQAYFHEIGPGGLLDDHLFHDGMHPSMRGQIALAQAVLRGLRARRAFGWPEGAEAPVLDPAEAAERFGLGPAAWEKICHWGIMFYDRVAPARFDPSERRARQDAFGKAADRIAAGAAPESVGLPNVGVPGPVPPWTPPVGPRSVR